MSHFSPIREVDMIDEGVALKINFVSVITWYVYLAHLNYKHRAKKHFHWKIIVSLSILYEKVIQN